MLEKLRHHLKFYGVSVLAVGVATVLTKVLEPVLAPTILPLFFAAVAASSWYGGLRPGLVAAILSTVVVKYFYISPALEVTTTGAGDFIRLAIFFVVAAVISLLNSDLRVAKRNVEQLSDRRLQASEEQLRLALQATHMGTWNWDLVTGAIVWSPEHEQLFGLAPGAFDGQYETFDERLYPDDREGLQQAVQTAIREHGIYKHEYRIIWSDGSIHWVEGRGQTFYNEAGEPVRMTGTIMNIDDRKRAETEIKQLNAELEQRVTERTAELQRTNMLLNNFFNAASSAAIGLCIHDRDLRFVQINEALAAINGHSVEAHLGKTTAELVPSLAPIVTPLHQRVLETGQPIINLEIEAAVSSPSDMPRYWLASYFPIFQDDGSTETAGFGVIVIEISDRKRAEAIVLESNRRWHSLLDNVQLIVVGLNCNGDVEYINPFFLQLTGYTSEEVLGKHWFDHFLPQSQKSSMKFCFQEVLENEFHPHYQNSIVTKFGEERMIAWSNTLLQNAKGQPIGTISIGEDITERYKLERMKAEFVSIVSHELRTPLTSISGALELLSTGLIQPESARGQEAIEIAATEADRLTRLVNDILDLERLESGKIRLEHQLWDLAELMRRAADFMQLAANQANITLAVEPLSVVLEIDGDRILQVLTNLLSNAIKFSPDNSTISLTAEIYSNCKSEEQGAQPSKAAEHQKGEKVLLPTSHSPRLTPHSPHVLITVRDRGRGIPANKLESIFERFQQVDASDSRKKGGTGLGLAICRSIVQQHDGNIWAESILDEGSSFHFTLPMTND